MGACFDKDGSDKVLGKIKWGFVNLGRIAWQDLRCASWKILKNKLKQGIAEAWQGPSQPAHYSDAIKFKTQHWVSGYTGDHENPRGWGMSNAFVRKQRGDDPWSSLEHLPAAGLWGKPVLQQCHSPNPCPSRGHPGQAEVALSVHPGHQQMGTSPAGGQGKLLQLQN